MIEQDTLTIPNTKYNRFCWAFIRVWAGLFILQVVIVVLILFASVAGAQTLFDVNGITHKSIMVDGEMYIISTIDNGSWSRTTIFGPGGSASSSTYDLGLGYSSSYISAEPSMWGYEDHEGDLMKGLLFLETYQQTEAIEDQKQLEHKHWMGCGHPKEHKHWLGCEHHQR